MQELRKVGIHFAQVTPRCSMGRWTKDIDLNLALTTRGRFKSSRRGSPARLIVGTILPVCGGTTVLSVLVVV